MNKQQLASKIWKSANKMRSKIEANEYKDYIDDRKVINEMHFIRKTCNTAVHEDRGTESDVIFNKFQMNGRKQK